MIPRRLLGVVSDQALARRHGVSRSSVVRLRRRLDIPPAHEHRRVQARVAILATALRRRPLTHGEVRCLLCLTCPRTIRRYMRRVGATYSRASGLWRIAR